MAWLLHPDDFESLKARLPAASPGVPTTLLEVLTGVELRPSARIERGHIEDTDHPELGMPTFAEFGTRQAELFEARMREWHQAMTLVKTMLAPPLNRVAPGRQPG